MRMEIRRHTTQGLLLLICLAVPTLAGAATPTKAPAATSQPQTVWVAVPTEAALRPDMIYATGEGAVPDAKEQPNRAKAYIQAKTYAKMAAIASLAQEVRGTAITYLSSGNSGVADTRIKEEIKAVLDTVQVVSAKKRPEGKDTIVEVTVRAPKPTIAKKAPVHKKEPAPKRPTVPSWMGGAGVAAKDGCYTSLVVDATRKHILRSMSPRILRADGTEVWGTLKLDPDALSDYGTAAYAHTRAEAFANRRCGDNPLVLRALSRGSSATNSDVVISDSDADRLIEEDRRGGFLNDLRVIIVVD